ncbi:glycosyltransferase family 4 protein [Frankia sp. CNm7]|uniref:Glycosyltransferase family 4 protein n=1 Tax=Frankia nepalensis TaxID=1836974 RepID=A0A937USK1_9ACTN|nr:glycosyltransferase family 4 protein [Frankia nepalensis]MBL7499287.1 glycosyltransferase family 4 protein [Frankia nepalensis]MBL7512365.1 glycosyltransferase family 4 protein [Frankia nepalensis]MBL7522572.1 glycosyltransferase family 4 protein [Frankia nepalensis]MBL7632203.1 glycosyltransferase family 4 protein [Frankia nepalensis]
MTAVAFCLLTYRPNHPSGIERSIAALTAGLRSLGHSVVVIAGGPAEPGDEAEPGLIRLESVRLPRPALNADVLAALAEPGPVVAEVSRVLGERRIEVVCWGAPVWGLGYLNPAPRGVRTALMMHNKIRPGSAETWRTAMAAADVVLPASPYLVDAAVQDGWDTSAWRVVPNGVLTLPQPPDREQRERLRQSGPLRVVSRVAPVKGQAPFLAAMPRRWDRRVEIVLAEADFEFEVGEQAAALAACRKQAARRPDVVQLLPALGWWEVPSFFAGAAATVISSLEPETFSHTAAEALSAGTPVITFGHGYVPTLIGPAGRVVSLRSGFPAVWDALDDLLANAEEYHAASRSAPARLAAHTPEKAAEAFLAATAAAPA